VITFCRWRRAHASDGSDCSARSPMNPSHPWFMTQDKGSKRSLGTMGAEQTERGETETLRTGPRSARLVPADRRRICAKLLAK
jgi:hypothetical protein